MSPKINSHEIGMIFKFVRYEVEHSSLSIFVPFSLKDISATLQGGR